MTDAHKNFAYSTVATAPSPATSGTSLVVASGEGARFPAVPFNAVITVASATRAQVASVSEIVRVTARATDTLTITRAQEGTSARTVIVGDEIWAGETALSLTDIEGGGLTVLTTKGDLLAATAASTATRLAVGTSITDRLIPDSAASTGLKYVPHIVRRTADSAARNSGNTGTTLTADDTLLWAVAANEIWLCEPYLLVSAANATMDFKMDFSVPTSGTANWGVVGNNQANITSWSPVGTASGATAMLGAGSSLAMGTFAGTMGAALAGIFVIAGTAGNVTLRWAQNTSDASDLKLLANSFLRLTRLA